MREAYPYGTLIPVKVHGAQSLVATRKVNGLFPKESAALNALIPVRALNAQSLVVAACQVNGLFPKESAVLFAPTPPCGVLSSSPLLHDKLNTHSS